MNKNQSKVKIQKISKALCIALPASLLTMISNPSEAKEIAYSNDLSVFTTNANPVMKRIQNLTEQNLSLNLSIGSNDNSNLLHTDTHTNKHSDVHTNSAHANYYNDEGKHTNTHSDTHTNSAHSNWHTNKD